MAEGFFHSSILFALLKLRIFELIDKGIKTLHELAAELGTQPETLSRLLNAGVVLKLLQSKDGITFNLSPLCRTILSPSAGEQYFGDWIRSLDYFCAPLLKLDEAVLNSRPTIERSSHLGGDKESTRSFTLSMHNYASLRGKELADFLSTAGCKYLLDLGCGPAVYSVLFCEQYPELQVTAIDLPHALEFAREYLADKELRDRICEILCTNFKQVVYNLGIRTVTQVHGARNIYLSNQTPTNFNRQGGSSDAFKDC